MPQQLLFMRRDVTLSVQLVSFVDLDLFQARPTPVGIEEAEQLCRLMSRGPALALAGKKACELIQTRPWEYVNDAVLRLLLDATKGL